MISTETPHKSFQEEIMWGYTVLRTVTHTHTHTDWVSVNQLNDNY